MTVPMRSSDVVVRATGAPEFCGFCGFCVHLPQIQATVARAAGARDGIVCLGAGV
jgi:hypothetical protein